MLEKLTSVSPPQTDQMTRGLRSEKREDVGLKSEFKDNLNKLIAKNDKRSAEKDRSHEKPNNFSTLKKENQPGENKKKVGKKESDEDEFVKSDKKSDEKFDPTMISMNMVSIESEVEIPDDEKNLAMFEESNAKSDLGISTDVSLPQQKLQSAVPMAAPLAAEQMDSANYDLVSEADIVESVEVSVADQPVQKELSALKEQDVLTQSSINGGLELSPEAVEALTDTEPSKDFQTKVMDVLKKEKFELPELKSKIDESAAGSFESNLKVAGRDASLDSDAKSNSDAKSSKDDFVKTDGAKMNSELFESKHLGQSDFHSTLGTQHSDHVSATGATGKTETANDPSVKELLNQANYLVTKGGGEVTLKMNSSEGMGEVHLKVMMDNGRMNIELNTQDKSVKKLIEDSLSDLRSSLAARQISLDHVKINSVNATNTENNTQFSQSQSNSSGSDSNQSKTFEQFQQQMQQHSQRQSAQTAQKTFSKDFLNADRPVVLPMMNAQRSAAQSYYGLNKGGSLNAVA